MDLISSWSPGTVSAYLKGLEPSVQHYPFQEWAITGQDLLDLSPQQLDALGVKSIGHQEIILEAVEQLCALHYDLHRESLRSLTDKLYRVAQMLSTHIIALKKASSVSQPSALSPTHKQLASIIDIVAAARGLFSWLNRYLFTRLNDYSASRDVIALCVELSEMLHKDWTDQKIEARILTICENICGICKSILNCSPDSLLSQTATLEQVHIYPKPSHSLGLEIKSTSSGQHFVGQTAPESPARQCEQILPGDEIIKVNEQVVVGWTHKNLVCKLQEKSNRVTLILKKVTVSPPKTPVSSNKTKTSTLLLTDRSPPPSYHSIHLPASPNVCGPDSLLKENSVPISPKHKSLLATQSAPAFSTENKLMRVNTGSGSAESLDQALYSAENLSGVSQNWPSKFTSQGNTWSCPGSSTESKPLASDVFVSVTPTSSELLAQLEMSFPTLFAKSLTPIAQYSSELEPENVKHSSRPRSGSDSTSTPANSLLEPPSANLRPSISDSNLSNKKEVDVLQQSKNLETSSRNTEREPQPTDTDKHSQFKKETSDRSTRYQKATKLSRRRVSCRDLGSPDCDGWLSKRKENVGFMSQKWKRCYCVLKKDKLYWYNGPQDEKALGMLNLSAYYLEHPRESKHRKKYEFQLTHQTYKPFVFAADNLTDMNKWVTCLVKTLQKYKTNTNSRHSREEDCYSETEAEDDEHCRTPEVVKKQAVQSPVKSTPGASPVSTRDKGAEGVQMPNFSSTQPQGDDLELMMTCLKQGGVSLIGKKTAMTRDEYRKSFVKRNKNPDINNKAHTLRVLQSTLKAKLHELEALNQILENTNLDSATFQKWKSEHEQLYGSVGKGSAMAAAENLYGMDMEGTNDKNKAGSDESEASD